MSDYSDPFLKTQIGRGVALHYDKPDWLSGPHKPHVKSGLLIGVEDGRLVVSLPDEKHPTRVRVDADQPAYATPDGMWCVWWEFKG